MLNKFAQELKKAREKADITLQNLSARSRLDIKFLQSIEKGDFSFLPELYVKAFIKDYAKFVGLDVNETIKNKNKPINRKAKKLLFNKGINPNRFTIENASISLSILWLLINGLSTALIIKY